MLDVCMLPLACTGHLAQLVEQRNSTWLEQHINVLVIGSSPIVATTIFSIVFAH